MWTIVIAEPKRGSASPPKSISEPIRPHWGALQRAAAHSWSHRGCIEFFFLPAIALGWDFLYTAIEPPAGLVDLYCGVLRRGLGVVESALNVVWTNCLWNTLAIVLPLGCVYVFSMFLCYFRALHAHDTGNIWRQKRGLYFFMWKHRILTGCAGQLLAFWKISVGPLHQGLSQWEQCDALKSVLL